MKFHIITLIFFFNTFASAQKISTTRIGDLKLGITLAEAEGIVQQRIEINRLNQEDWGNYNAATVAYNGNKVKLKFIETSEGDFSEWTIYKLSTTDRGFKTLSNLGVGSSLEQLLNAYKKYEICIYKDWREEAGKDDRLFTLTDHDAGTVLMFYLQNNKVYKIEIYPDEGCC